jgi:hypothetical protein
MLAVEVIKVRDRGRTAEVRRLDGLSNKPIICNTNNRSEVGMQCYATFDRTIKQWSLVTV